MLVSRTNSPVEIRNNGSRKNGFIKPLLQDTVGPCWSLEISPSSGYNSDVIKEMEISPLFVAVTWLGNMDLQLPICDIPAIALSRKLSQCKIPVLMHLCGRNILKDKMVEILDYLKECGVKNVLALQGDWLHVIERDDSKCDFPYAADLVLFIKTHYADTFNVAVAGYPHGHPHSRSLDEDMKYLKLKVSNGADFIITQASFDYESLERFANNCKSHDINVPILAGFLVIKSYKTLITMAEYCNLKISEEILDFVKAHKDDDILLEKYGIDLVTDLITKCKEKPNFFSGVHVFSMNDIDRVKKVLSRIEF